MRRMALLQIIAALGGVAALDLAAARLFTRLYRNERRPDALHFATTEDGWTIGLHQYDPPPGVAVRRPVLCCHGLAGNHHSFDLTARTSLARFLAQAGHPTFLMNLRGAGAADRGGAMRGRPLHWKLSHHYRFDAPAAVAKVCELTGASRLHWVGHSMGGMVAYALLQTPLAERIERCVILASPARFDFYRKAYPYRFFLKLIPGVPVATLSQSTAPLFEYWRFLQVATGNRDLLPGHAALSAVNCQDQLPTSLLYDFTRFIKAGRFVGDDGTDLLAGMGRITTPTLFMVGEADQTVANGAVQAAYEAFGSPEKKLVVLGKRYGHHDEYGHMTILLGGHVYDEVFPHITDWLAKG
jgi:pimeloyl-ACP methyl ester carboxylesterase